MRALILVDLQNDFCKGGALEVKNGDAAIPIANLLIPKFDIVVATQEWHPANHGSFAANHLWRKPGQVINLHGLQQVLSTLHCVQNSFGAMFHKALNTEGVHKIIQKGTDPEVDSYSGFFDNGRRKQTDLHHYLSSKNVNEVYVMGLTTDYCVKYTALDSVSLGYKTYFIEDGSWGMNLTEGDADKAILEIKKAGVKIVQSSEF